MALKNAGSVHLTGYLGVYLCSNIFIFGKKGPCFDLKCTSIFFFIRSIIPK